MVRFSAGPFPFEPAKLFTATASSFAIYFPKCKELPKELKNERRNLSERKYALPPAASACHNCHRRRSPHRAASLEFHARWCHGFILRRNPQRSPPRLRLSAARTLRRRPLYRFLQAGRHAPGLREFPAQRPNRPISAWSPYLLGHQRRHSSRLDAILLGHQFRHLGSWKLLPTHACRACHLLRRRCSLFLEHARRRCFLRHCVFWRLRLGRALRPNFSRASFRRNLLRPPCPKFHIPESELASSSPTIAAACSLRSASARPRLAVGASSAAKWTFSRLSSNAPSAKRAKKSAWKSRCAPCFASPTTVSPVK